MCSVKVSFALAMAMSGLAGSRSFAGDPRPEDFALKIDSVEVCKTDPAAVVQADVRIMLDFDVGNVAGFYLSICTEDPAVAVPNEAVASEGVLKAKCGATPDFVRAYVHKEGVEFAVAVQFANCFGGCVMPAAQDFLALTITYDVIGSRTSEACPGGYGTSVFACETLATPPTASYIGVRVEGPRGCLFVPFGSPKSHDGEIRVGYSAPRFIRGEVNGDGRLDIADPIALLGYIFGGEPAPGCVDAADANDSGELDIADAIWILSYIFANADPPKPPFGEVPSGCGMDPTDDTLDCESFEACQ